MTCFQQTLTLIIDNCKENVTVKKKTHSKMAGRSPVARNGVDTCFHTVPVTKLQGGEMAPAHWLHEKFYYTLMSARFL